MSISETRPFVSFPLADPGPAFDVQARRDVRIPTGDNGVTLAADLYLPVGRGVIPALVMLLPYPKDGPLGIPNAGTMRWFASRGYACLLVDMRGTGSSDGDQRPPFDAGEADDGVAAVEWCAAQPWCSGNVGMFGMSYGAIATMRTASRRPPHLKAIAPMMGGLDPELDMVNPSGIRGCLTTALWGTITLVNQLIPPLEDYANEEQQRRWHNRLLHVEPWLVDLFRHGPGHPVWRSRAIDASAIKVPAFLFAGWQDWFCDAIVRAYENIDAPKKLMIGPWGHVLPNESTINPVDHQRILFHWWEHWLNGVDNGIMDEPQLTLFEQGNSPRWRGFASQPLTNPVRLVTSNDLTLRASPEAVGGLAAAMDLVIGKFISDATVRPFSGLWTTQEFPALADHQGDHRYGVLALGEPLAEDLAISGRPVVTATLAPGSTFSRIVVRLSHVDRFSKPTLITMGMAPSGGAAGSCTATLAPCCYRVPAGHRLQVTVGDADFPWLWPAIGENGGRGVLLLTEIELTMPTLPDTEGRVVDLPEPDPVASQIEALTVAARPRSSITGGTGSDALEIKFGSDRAFYTFDNEHLIEQVSDVTMTLTRANPEAARVRDSTTVTTTLGTGETIVTRIELDMTQSSLSLLGETEVDGTPTYSRRWSC